ncbi:MAG: hypothetical protein IPN87_13950 [Saprospiraceae bacterium]|nr:hypothetical protein [Candidatus Brachybacter algidus]
MTYIKLAFKASIRPTKRHCGYYKGAMKAHFLHYVQDVVMTVSMAL